MQIHRQVKNLIKQLLQQLAPDTMKRGELTLLSKAAGLGETTIRNAKHREGLTADTLLALLIAHGVDSKDILHLPRKKPSRAGEINFKWSQLGFGLTEKEKKFYMDFISWHKKRLKGQ